MSKKILISYVAIVVVFLSMMSLSRQTSETMRGGFFSLFKEFINQKIFFKTTSRINDSLSFELERMQIENLSLKNELSFLSHVVESQMSIVNQLKELHSIEKKELIFDYKSSFERLLRRLEYRIQSIPARVIFRSYDLWNQSLWIDAGEATNAKEGKKIVVKNSPVVVGHAIVGLIDYVGTNQSRVQLITDSHLTLSVRAVRGGEQEFIMSEHLTELAKQLNKKREIFSNQKLLLQYLEELRMTLSPLKKSWYLAKGELSGISSSSRRGQKRYLKGTGFNYDFSDECGEACDLRESKDPSKSILKEGDVLVTTGLDGIFPKGFQAGIVSKIQSLKEGDYFYQLEAKPAVSSFEELSHVFVLPPINEQMEIFN